MFGEYLQQCLLMIFLCSGIPLLFSSAAGLMVAVIQTATQVQEQTILFLVKFCTVAALVALIGEWLARRAVAFLQELLGSIVFLGRM